MMQKKEIFHISEWENKISNIQYLFFNTRFPVPKLSFSFNVFLHRNGTALEILLTNKNIVHLKANKK